MNNDSSDNMIFVLMLTFALLAHCLNGFFIAENKLTVTVKNRVGRVQGSSLDDDDFMESLRNRIQEVAEEETKMPLVVLDSMLPRQILRIKVKNPLFKELVRERIQKEHPYFGMMGLARLAAGEQVHLRDGVEVEILENPVLTEDGGVALELKAGRRFRIDGEVNNNPRGWTEARVRFINTDDEQEEDITEDRMSVARAMIKAKEFTSPNMNIKDNQTLIARWIQLAKENEREVGQIDTLLEQLGEIPPSEEPTERAFWVGALINPIPALGVAMEIRPALLTANSTEQRVQIALDAILKSIRHMDGTARMW